METLINNQPTNSPLSDSDISLTHFSEWSRADRFAFASLVVGVIGTFSILLAFISIYYAHRAERREGCRVMEEQQNKLREALDKLAPKVEDNSKEN